MNTYIMSLGIDIWLSVENGYQVSKTLPIDLNGKENYLNNAKTNNVMLFGLTYTEIFKVMNYKCTKEIWDKL